MLEVPSRVVLSSGRDNMAASKSQPIANEFKLARSAGHDFAGYPAFWGGCAAGIYPNTLGKTTYP